MPRCRRGLELAPTPARRTRGRAAECRGREAEDAACRFLAGDGWAVVARRLRTPAGEIDILAERNGIVSIIEVKQRATLDEAAASVSPRQQRRLMMAAELVLARHPQLGAAGVRFDVILLDAAGQVRRIEDAFRLT